MRLVYTDQAEADLRSILRYTKENWGAAKARDYADGLELHLEKLTDFPKLGAAIEEGMPGTRRWPFVSHIAYYRIVSDEVRIVRILHSSQAPELHLD